MPHKIKKLILLFIVFPLILFSQPADSARVRRISVGLAFSPDYCYRSLSADPPYDQIVELRDTIEVPKFGYTTGIKAGVGIFKRFNIEIGFLFSLKGYRTVDIGKYYVTSSGQPDPNIPKKARIYYQDYYLDFPLKVSYRFLKIKRGNLFASAGFSPNIFLTEKTVSKSEYNDGRKTKSSSTYDLSKYNSVNLSFTEGLGYSYRIGEKFMLKAEGIYRRSINSIIDAPIEGYLYSAGIDVGFYYRF